MCTTHRPEVVRRELRASSARPAPAHPSAAWGFSQREVGRSPTGLASAVHDSTLEVHDMLLAIALVIAIAWLLGFTVFHVASGAIHILLIVAVVVAIVHFVQGRRAPL
jgi:hypothetical protein